MADIPSIALWVVAWIFLVVGIASLAVLIIYTKYGREISIRLSILTVVISSVFLGFALHFLLISLGI